MFDLENFKKHIFSINESNFNAYAIEAFKFQYEHNKIYKMFCKSLGKSPRNIHNYNNIPFLPIQLFKTNKIVSGQWKEEKVFLSSGTTGINRSKHYLRNEVFYHSISRRIFESQFEQLSDVCIYAILPSYLENNQSSLLSMIDYFIKESSSASGYYFENQLLPSQPSKNEIIFGVTYALLDGTVEHKSIKNCTIIDTGGMKGRKKELTRNEVTEQLKNKYNQEYVWSEYGMTEMTSQAYGKNGKMRLPNWAKCIIRDINDPFSILNANTSGGINIIDLANIETCCFIETQDLGMNHENGYFEVIGRFDNSDIRGCSLLI